MAMQAEEYEPWMKKCTELVDGFTKKKMSMSFESLQSVAMSGHDLSFVKEAVEMKNLIDGYYAEAKELQKEGEDLSLLNREPKPSSKEVEKFLQRSRTKFNLPCHSQLSNLLSTQQDLESQVKGIILDNNINFSPGNLFKAMNIITSSPMQIDDDQLGLPTAVWSAACRTMEFYEVKALNSIFLRVPISALRRLQATAPAKRTGTHKQVTAPTDKKLLLLLPPAACQGTESKFGSETSRRQIGSLLQQAANVFWRRECDNFE